MKKRVEAVMLKHHKKLLPNPNRKLHNSDPERQFVILLLNHLKNLFGFIFDVIESSTFNRQLGQHTEKVTRAGFSDLVGNDHEGRAMYIECKAPGKRNTLRPDQRIFLTEKINHGCFAICWCNCARP